MEPDLLSPPISKLEDLVNHTIITIAVQDGKLRVFPKRGEDTVLYSTDVSEEAAPEKPREVRWVVKGKAPDQKIVIRQKKGSRSVLAKEYVIEGNNNNVRSGRSSEHPSRDHQFVWSYRLSLLDSKGNELDSIDPDVVVKSDP